MLATQTPRIELRIHRFGNPGASARTQTMGKLPPPARDLRTGAESSVHFRLRSLRELRPRFLRVSLSVAMPSDQAPEPFLRAGPSNESFETRDRPVP